MERFEKREMSARRILNGGLRRVLDIPDSITWALGNKSVSENKERLARYKDKHLGERCFLIANGPSLKTMDLSLIKNQNTIGLNRIYLLFEDVQFIPTYYVVIDEVVIEQYFSDIKTINAHKFINWNKRRYFDQHQPKINYLKIKHVISDSFVDDLTRPISSGGTVTFVSLQLAYFMGFSEVILIGLDHNYFRKGIPNLIEKRNTEADQAHFHPNYNPIGGKLHTPDLRRTEIAYQKARDFFETNSRRIFDATIDGKCTIFKKVDYYSLFKN